MNRVTPWWCWDIKRERPRPRSVNACSTKCVECDFVSTYNSWNRFRFHSKLHPFTLTYMQNRPTIEWYRTFSVDEIGSHLQKLRFLFVQTSTNDESKLLWNKFSTQLCQINTFIMKSTVWFHLIKFERWRL